MSTLADLRLPRFHFNCRRPGLLISVRNADEAVIAMQGGADLIDVKEPLRGSLGAPDRTIVRQVTEAVAGRSPISVAGGELLDCQRGAADVEPWQDVDFVKLGLAGCGPLPDWVLRWQRIIERVRGTAAPVAVVYADWRTCEAPPPEAVLTAATDVDSVAVLLDTFDKSQGNLFDHWSVAELARFIDQVRSNGRMIVLAGSLRDEALSEAIQLRPDLVAVRGAACVGGRAGSISLERVCEIRNLLGDRLVEAGGDTATQLAQFLPLTR